MLGTLRDASAGHAAAKVAAVQLFRALVAAGATEGVAAVTGHLLGAVRGTPSRVQMEARQA
jgi:hypothetical protein